jgi:hypothetical protein
MPGCSWRVLGEDGGDQVAFRPLPVQVVVHREPGGQSCEQTFTECDQPCREDDPGVGDVAAVPERMWRQRHIRTLPHRVFAMADTTFESTDRPVALFSASSRRCSRRPDA